MAKKPMDINNRVAMSLFFWLIKAAPFPRPRNRDNKKGRPWVGIGVFQKLFFAKNGFIIFGCVARNEKTASAEYGMGKFVPHTLL
jgi:hypothetical protein